MSWDSSRVIWLILASTVRKKVRRLLNESFLEPMQELHVILPWQMPAGALVVSGLVDELREGVELAAKTVDSGKAEEKLKNLIKFSQANHQQA